MADLVTLDVQIDPKSMARAIARLDKWKGASLAVRTQRATHAGMALLLSPIKARAARHNRTGATQKGYNIFRGNPRSQEIAVYTLHSTTPWKNFAITGTSRGVSPDPYVDAVKRQLEPRVVGFIADQITRLA
jgi:hypothetical protein